MNLTALLALAALVDLVLGRLVLRLFVTPAWRQTGAGQWLDRVAIFNQHLVGILAAALFVGAFLGVLRRRELFPGGMRVSAVAFGFGFALAVVVGFGVPQMSGRIALYLKTTFGFLAWILALAASRPPTPWRAKLGVTLFVFPSIFHAVALFASRLGLGVGRDIPHALAAAGLLCGLAAAASAPWTLGAPLGGRLRGVAGAVGLLAAGGMAVAELAKYDLVRAIATNGFAFEPLPSFTPLGASQASLLVLAAGGLATFLVQGFRLGGAPRLAAFGATLIVVAGYQIGAPGDLAVAACGILALTLGVTRNAAARLAAG